MVSAIITNSITNGLSAFVMLFCFIGASIHLIRKRQNYTSIYIPVFFLVLLAMKLLAILVHALPDGSFTDTLWVVIALLMVFLNYLVTHSMQINSFLRILVVAISLFFCLFFIKTQNFIYMALPLGATYLLVASICKSWLRVGFLLIVLSNVIWIGARYVTEYIIGGTLPIQYRYDNDIYHFLIIIAVVMIYRSIGRYWPLDQSADKPA
ncbi:MAG: hypothetical protein JXR42_02210 [Gammaproteobacteria bacterium]|nr:hypothetical protein [Gammaproteobacteria bacterium]